MAISYKVPERYKIRKFITAKKKPGKIPGFFLAVSNYGFFFESAAPGSAPYLESDNTILFSIMAVLSDSAVRLAISFFILPQVFQ